MKKNIFLYVIGLNVALLSGMSNYAQSATENLTRIDAKALITSGLALISSETDKKVLEQMKVNLRIFQHFSKAFENAHDIAISETKGYTFVTCKVDGAVNRILYNKKGRWQRTISTYETDKLPADVREVVEYSYPGFTIFGAVTEVRVGNKVAHLVLIENKSDWKRIKVVNGDQEIYEEYHKM